MNNKAKRNFSLIFLAVGFLIAIQFQTVQKPDTRDTRDVWDIRQELLSQLEQQSILLSQIQTQDQTIQQYQEDQEWSNEQAFLDTVSLLEKEAGLTEVTGPGITFQLEPIMEEFIIGKVPGKVTPDLLRRLVNQLYRFDAQHISISDQRIVATSVIRDINGKTTVNGLPIPPLPFNITVVTKDRKDAEKLSNRMKSSVVMEDFFIDDIRLTVSDPIQNLKVPAYYDLIQVRSMKSVSIKEGE